MGPTFLSPEAPQTRPDQLLSNPTLTPWLISGVCVHTSICSRSGMNFLTLQLYRGPRPSGCSPAYHSSRASCVSSECILSSASDQQGPGSLHCQASVGLLCPQCLAHSSSRSTQLRHQPPGSLPPHLGLWLPVLGLLSEPWVPLIALTIWFPHSAVSSWKAEPRLIPSGLQHLMKRLTQGHNHVS